MAYKTEEGKKRTTHMISQELYARVMSTKVQYGLKSKVHETLWNSFMDLLEENPTEVYTALWNNNIKVVIEE